MDLNVCTEQRYWPGPLMKLPIRLGDRGMPNSGEGGIGTVEGLLQGREDVQQKKTWFQVIRSSA
jgi:hypothetical protein